MVRAAGARSEQFAPQQFPDFPISVEQQGFDTMAVSGHFQPMAAPRRSRADVVGLAGGPRLADQSSDAHDERADSTLHYQPVVTANAFATLACLSPGRIVLGIGTGKAMNGTPATGIDWLTFNERADRLRESVALSRKLWPEERVTFQGTHYPTEKPTIYDLADNPVPIFVAAGGSKSERRRARSRTA